MGLDKEISLILDKNTVKEKQIKLKGHIYFVKGKIIDNTGDFKKPYLNMDYLSANAEPLLSSSGVLAQTEDTIMLMDGASSGLVFSGYNGYIGSTFALIKHDETINPFVLFAVLKENASIIKERPTGSAIPHADKRLIEETNYPLLGKQAILKIESLLRLKWNIINKCKALVLSKTNLLKKFF